MKTLVVLSGGLDSSVLLYHILSTGSPCRAISFDYGQRHSKELASAAVIAAEVRVPHLVVTLPRFDGYSALLGNVEVPNGHYEDAVMKQTVVPNRNMVMLSIAVANAIAAKEDRVVYAAHRGDHTIYPDCREAFVVAMASAVNLCDWSPPKLEAPFVGMSKADIVRLGLKLGVPFSKTWSCYRGRDLHCGLCGTCVERLEAFSEAGVGDPVGYERAYV